MSDSDFAYEIPAWYCAQCNTTIHRNTPPTIPAEPTPGKTRQFNTKGRYACACTNVAITDAFPTYWKLR